MVAVRRLHIEHFRGFSNFALTLPQHAVLAGEPGAGRSDFIEALVRLLDADYLRQRRGEELDFFDGDMTAPAGIEAVVGDLTEAQARALNLLWEWWDPLDERLITEAPTTDPVDPDRHERVVRIAYRMSAAPDGSFDERVYWPKRSDPTVELFDPVKRSERAFLPFFWQRGVSMRPLDLAGRGELRDLIDRQAGEDFPAAVDRFVAEVSDASARFSDQDRVKAALEAIFEPIRTARRILPADASQLVRFLPDGGAPSGLLRSLTAAVTLSDGPGFLPATRHGSTLVGALRAGALVAASKHQERAIVAVDDFGGEFDPHLALHLARELRELSGQAIVTTRTPSVIDAFRISEIVRFYRSPAGRTVAHGPQGTTRAERVAAQFYAGRLTRVLGASAVIVVDGVHDRLALEALERRATAARALPSLAGAGIVYVDVGGSGQLHKVAQAAKQLGLYVIALLDNDQPANARPNADVRRTIAEADVGLWLPPGCKLEWALTDGVSDTDLHRAVSAIAHAMPDLQVPPGFSAVAGGQLQAAVRTLLHETKGTIHAAYVEALHQRRLAPTAIDMLTRLRRMAVDRADIGLVRW